MLRPLAELIGDLIHKKIKTQFDGTKRIPEISKKNLFIYFFTNHDTAAPVPNKL
jgi:hypothetical protein